MNTHYYFVLIILYFSGRLLSFNINTFLNTSKRQNYLLRIFTGLTVFIFFENIFAAVAIFMINSLAVLNDHFLVTKKQRNKISILLIQYLVVILLGTLTFSLIDFETFYVFNPLMIFLIPLRSSIIYLDYLFMPERLHIIVFVLAGFLFTIKEATIIIRLILKKVSVAPRKKESNETDPKEYERGKLIGILERSLIYFLVLFNQIGAVAVVIALKSLARFKDLENREFAEYFLIGSLLSILTAAIPAVLIKYLTSI